MSPISRTRDELIGDLRALCDALAADEAIPFTSRAADISHHVLARDDADGIERLHEIAAILGVEPTTTDAYGGRHHLARKAFGGITYQAVYVERQVMDEYDEASRIVAEHRAGKVEREAVSGG